MEESGRKEINDGIKRKDIRFKDENGNNKIMGTIR